MGHLEKATSASDPLFAGWETVILRKSLQAQYAQTCSRPGQSPNWRKPMETPVALARHSGCGLVHHPGTRDSLPFGPAGIFWFGQGLNASFVIEIRHVIHPQKFGAWPNFRESLEIKPLCFPYRGQKPEMAHESPAATCFFPRCKHESLCPNWSPVLHAPLFLLITESTNAASYC